jgi:hypothetical protein
MASLFAFAGAAGYMLYLLGRWNAVDVRDETIRYSGIDPDEYRLFAREMYQVENTIVDDPRQAARHLYKGLDHFSNLGTHNNYDVQEEIHEIEIKIGRDVERRILEQALVRGISFTPRYLNNTLI